MGELSNCPNCNAIFVKTQFRSVCEACYKKEENSYEAVYKFLRKRENRTAQLHEVIETTGVEEELILKFIRNGRIQISNFPNLSYPCGKCGASIREGKLCDNCETDIKSQIHQLDQEQSIRERNKAEEKRATFYASKPKW
ncbi:TIGR03826 family flagellar region protein [Metabacillus herbersteinensis]|uniref:TIGR03826 family flagellar region protein n=1 Tax=Metabacillus herbersteinensis TaxID=283816 RepID=A0ABV6GFI5_9BACI